MTDTAEQPNATGVSAPPDGGNVTSTAPPPQETPQGTPQAQAPQAPQTTQPQVSAQVQPQQVQQPALPPAPKGVDPNSAYASHPSVQRAGVLHTIAQALAGGNRVRTTIDPETGVATRQEVPLSTKDIGMAIALEALGGAAKGYSVPNGPGNLGRAAAAATSQGIDQKVQAAQAQEQQAQSDKASQYQAIEANLRMHNLAMQTGRLGLDSHQSLVAGSSQQLQYLKDNSPEMIAGHDLSEGDASNLKDYPASEYYRLPDGVVPRVDSDGKQVYQNAHGQIVPEDSEGAIPAYDNTYSIVSRGAKVPAATDEGANDTLKGAVGWNIADKNWLTANPGSLMKGVTLSGLQHKVTALNQFQGTLDLVSKTLNESAAGAPSKTPELKDPVVQAMIDETAKTLGVNQSIARAIALQESGGSQSAKSNKGAIGVMQLMPETAKTLGVDPTNVLDNIKGGLTYFKQLLDEKHGDVKLALASYNAGPQNVTDHVPQNKETPGYVSSILKSIGMDGSSTSTTPSQQEFPETDLHDIMKQNPSTVNAIVKFQAMNNRTGNYGQAIDELRKQGPSGEAAADTITQLLGGKDVIGKYDRKVAETAEQTKKQNDMQAELSKQSADRAAKESENSSAYLQDAKDIAGDPNDPGSGDMVLLDKLISQRTADRPKVLAMIKAINPHWSMADAELKHDTWKNFTDSAKKPYQQVVGFNTLFDHIGSALDANQEYRRSNLSDYLNVPYNKFAEHVKSDPKFAQFAATQQPVKDEFMSLLLNNKALTDSDKKVGESLVNNATTPAVFEQVMKTIGETAAYRIKEANEPWKRVFQRNFPGMVSNEAVNAIQKMTDKDGKNKVADILKDMDVGGSILGSSNGRGVPGTPLSEVLGRTGTSQSQSGQQSQQQPSAQNNWGAQAGETPKFKGGQLAGYVDKNGQVTRYAGQPPRAPQQ